MKSLASGEGGIRRRVRRRRAVLKPDRIDNPTILDLAQKLASGVYERVLLCEGDSWFGIWTPAPLHEPNLLDALRTSRRTLLVDISHVGDTAKEMATDPQAANTLSLLNEFKFDTLLLSAGGNDLKNAFKELFIEKIVLTRKKMVVPKDLASITAHPAKAGSIIDEVVGYIVSWISLRQKSKLNKETPVVLHGYDYLQPRPAPARAWVNGLPVSGPWVYPTLLAAGKTDTHVRHGGSGAEFEWGRRESKHYPGRLVLHQRNSNGTEKSDSAKPVDSHARTECMKARSSGVVGEANISAGSPCSHIWP
jgi:hypothetical protein